MDWGDQWQFGERGRNTPFLSPARRVGKTRELWTSFQAERPGDWGGGRASNSKLPCSNRGHSGVPEGGHFPLGRQAASAPWDTTGGTAPSQAPGRGRVPAPTCLLPFFGTTPTGLGSPRERDGAGTKGSLFTGSWGVGVVLARVSPRPLETGRLIATRPRPAASAVLRDPSA